MDWKNRCNPCFILIWIFAIIVKTSSLARTLSAVEWDMNNEDFHPNGTYIEAEINDVVDIICPRQPDTPEGRQKAQYHTFTKVPYESYKSCNLTTANGAYKDLLSCNRPFDENKYTLLFQAWTPYPGGSIFEPGKDYYYITTSSGSPDGIYNEEGGLCESHKMRLRVHIKPTVTEEPKVPTTTRKAVSTTPKLVHTTKKTVGKSKPPPTEKPKSTKIGKKSGMDSQHSNSANRYQISSLLLLLTSLIARIRWH